MTLTLTDNAANSASRTFRFTVTPVNDLPVVGAIADISTLQDTPSAPVSFDVGDVETSTIDLILTATSTDPLLLREENILLAGADGIRTLRVVPAPGRSGSANVTVTVTDMDGGAASRSFQVTASGLASNAPPSFDALPDLVMDENGAPQVITVTGVSPNER